MNLTEEKRNYDGNLELLLRYRSGESEAGELLALQNRPLVYSIATRFVGRGADIDELVEQGASGL